MFGISSLVHAGGPSLVGALERLRSADDIELPAIARFDALDRVHAADIAPHLAKPDLLSDDELAIAFEAMDMLAFYALQATPSSLARYTGEMMRLLDALDSRSAATPRQVDAMFGALLAMRDLASVRGLIARFPGPLATRSIPRVTFAPDFDPDQPGMLVLRDDGALFAHNVDRSGIHVVAIIGCRQSQRALDAIKASQRLRDGFRRTRTIWLMPADRMTDPEFLRQWNARYPGQQAAFAYANAPWRGVDFSAMPAFQRFDGDRLVAKSKGWPRDGTDIALPDILAGE